MSFFEIDSMIEQIALKKIENLIKNNEANDVSSEILLLLLLLSIKTSKTTANISSQPATDSFHQLLDDLKEHQKHVFEELLQQLSISFHYEENSI